jgi:hypothetical protein
MFYQNKTENPIKQASKSSKDQPLNKDKKEKKLASQKDKDNKNEKSKWRSEGGKTKLLF